VKTINNSRLRIWIDAARPKTLPAAFVPVWIGSSLASYNQTLDLAASLVALVCAFLIQIGTNFANDYFDFVKGADTDERIGFTRATASGLIHPKTMLVATAITMGLAFLLGLYLVWVGGWIILVIGLVSLICGVAYTGGPYPLGYNGLGDLFVFIFFGIIAVTTTYYVNALEWCWEAFWASLSAGALSTNILVINNLRDTEQDLISGKRTLGVIFGDNALRIEYTALFAMAYVVPICFYLFLNYSLIIMLPVLTFPLAVKLIYIVWTEKNKRTFNELLENTAKCMFLFGLFFGIAIITGGYL